MDNLIIECESKMKKTLESFTKEISKIRGGSINKALFDEIKVDYYGAPTPLNQVCNINMNESSTILITPYDQSVSEEIVKSIQKSDLGFNPNIEKDVIIINVPPLTQERREELVKFLNKETESFRISIRNIRKEFNEEVKKLQKSKVITSDDEKTGLKRIQNHTDNYIELINNESGKKEKEILNI
ncbi:MAG: ribosome recycling factor [Thermodesulfobacteriota bacterium]|nr:ribosome recycling factor [Thermodesulfobacteriota bacterium]